MRARISVRMAGFFCAVLLLSGVPRPARTQTSANEYQIKAAFLFHFAQVVEWPDGDPSLSVCIFSDEPHRQEFQNTIEGKLAGARVLHVRLLNQPQDVQRCDILFLSRDEARRQTAVFKSLRGLPVLTVGETDNFLSAGGMIRFHLEKGKIRFDINLGAADSAHLKISSQLLLLATSVTRGGGMNRER